MHRLQVTLALSVVLAALGASYGGSLQAATPSGGVSRGWSAEDLAVLTSLHLGELPDAPDDPSNAWDSSAAAAVLGKLLFFDPRFSRNGTVSCSSCHDPQRQFQDDRQVGEGVGVGSRRTMPIVAAGYSPWLFWDGRKDSLWSQALGPLEDPLEHGGNRLRHARLIQGHYSQPYADLFGPLPDLSGLPDDAGPLGSAAEQEAWQAMDPAARDAVSRVFANLGKAVAAYERSLKHEPSRLDRYIEQQLRGGASAGPAALTPQEVRGLRLFIGKADCVSCHNGPLFTDQQFHNTGVPPRDARRPNQGRAAATARVRSDEFNCLGRYSDASPAQCEELRFLAEGDPQLEGAFRTPGLRAVALRPPYMHAGQFASLERVVQHYVRAPQAALGHSELGSSSWRNVEAVHEGEGRTPARLSAAEQRDLVAFLRAL
jgi:cytochrome c peroxidase